MKKRLLIIAMLLNVLFLYAQEHSVINKKPTLPVKTMIDQSKLIKPIKDHIAKRFHNATILNAYKNEADGLVTYSVHVYLNDSKWSLIFNDKGKYIRKEVIKQTALSNADFK